MRMRKLVFILIAFIAIITFIKAFDNSNGIKPERIFSGSTNTVGMHSGEFSTGETAPIVVK